MFRRNLIGSAAAFIVAAGMVLTIRSSTAMAQLQCKPVTGHIASQLLTGPECTSLAGLCTSGHFFGGIQGDFVFTATSLTPTMDTLLTGVVHYTGDIAIQTEDGDLSIKDAGGFNATPNGTGDVGSVSTIIGGSGKWAGASGRIRIGGTFTPSEGGDSDFRGEVCVTP